MVETIKVYCKKNNTTIAEVERECGIGNGTISRWDNSSPSFNYVIKVADHLNIPLKKLKLAIEDNKN